MQKLMVCMLEYIYVNFYKCIIIIIIIFNICIQFEYNYFWNKES